MTKNTQHSKNNAININTFMKKDTHPKYNENAKVTCACGNVFTIGSIKDEIRVELCNLCHPFYTGKQKFVDTARRVENSKKKPRKQRRLPRFAKARKRKKIAKKAKSDAEKK